MKAWAKKHLNWSLIIIAVFLPALVAGIISGAATSPVDYKAATFITRIIIFGIIIPVSCLWALSEKGRSGWWILLYPFTFIIIPLVLSSKTPSGQTPQRLT